VIEQNTIHHLKLYNCEQTIVENNTILELEIQYGGANLFKRNRMSQESYDNLINKFYEKRVEKYFNIMSWIMIPLIIVIIVFIYGREYFYAWMFSLFVISFIWPFTSLRIKKHKSKNLPENTIENNDIIDSKQLINES